MSTTVKVRFRVAYHPAATWTSNNPVLLAGEYGIESDTKKRKLGDGTTAWNALPYDGVTLGAALTAIDALTPAADRLAYFTGPTAAALATFTAFGRSLVDDFDATAGRSTLGLGTIATAAAGDYLMISGGTLTARLTVTATEAVRLVATSPFISFYNSAQTTRYGYVQHTGTDLAFVNEQNGAYDIYTNNTLRTRVEAAGHLRPGTDALYDLGVAGIRWNNIYAANGTIITSDRRAKRDIGAIPDAWLDAWASVPIVRFKFRDAVKDKGWEAARWHVGRIAQDVLDAFAADGIDAREIGVLCFDEWVAVPARRARKGTADSAPIPAAAGVAAGNRWGLRPDQCAALDVALQRRELTRLRETIAA